VEKTLTLRAPAGGYVLEKNVLAGQKIMAGDALYKVADLSTVWVEGEVFEQDIATVRVGQAVHADFDALPGEHRLGRISYIYPTLDPQTRTVRVRVVLPNSDLRLKPGMYATILIAGTERANVLTVPRSAVLATGERSIIFVRDASGSLTPREVSVGAANDERVEILRGLSPGETVVSSATFLVDAESNLGTALGGMGNMPGMDMTTPPKPLPAKP
jgi:Cu(I)/Ag(I) efflux system membrane fusion protein